MMRKRTHILTSEPPVWVSTPKQAQRGEATTYHALAMAAEDDEWDTMHGRYARGHDAESVHAAWAGAKAAEYPQGPEWSQSLRATDGPDALGYEIDAVPDMTTLSGAPRPAKRVDFLGALCGTIREESAEVVLGTDSQRGVLLPTAATTGEGDPPSPEPVVVPPGAKVDATPTGSTGPRVARRF